MAKKKTHEEFLKELTLKNEHYREGRIEMIGKYEKVFSGILVKDKYGVCRVMPSAMLKGSSVSIKSAVDKNSYFINQAKEIHGDKYDYSLVDYKGDAKKVQIKTHDGTIFEQTPSCHLQGRGYTGIVRCTKSFIKKANEVHDGKYDYSLVEWVSAKSKIKIISSCGTLFEQTPDAHLTGRGYRNIAKDKESFIKRAKEVHGNKYNYSVAEYINNTTELVIICSEHGEFLQKPCNHLSGHGCQDCGNAGKAKYHKENPHGWTYKNWEASGEKSKYFDSFKVYQIELWCEETGEKFFKIGKTYRKVFGKGDEARFPDKPTNTFNYKGKIVKTIEGDARQICELEKELQRQNKEFNYLPEKEFDGMYECFSQLISI